MKAIGADEITAFIDVETTGLSPEDSALLEVAVVLARGRNFTEVASASFTCLPEGVSALAARASANEYVLEMHKKSGLWDDLVEDEKSGSALRYGPNSHTLDGELVRFLDDHDVDGRPVFGGNSQNLDRAFLEAFAPEFYSRLSYRSLDETSVQFFSSTLGLIAELHSPADPGGHRGIADIRKCLANLRFQRRVLVRAAMGGAFELSFNHDETTGDLYVVFGGSDDAVELAASAVRASAILDHLEADLVFGESARTAQVVGRERDFTRDDIAAIVETSTMYS